MNPLEYRLHLIDQNLYTKLQETKSAVQLLLSQYSSNFPTYTDHSLKHTEEVFRIASEVLTDREIESLNSDELYILSMSCLLHDIGMCIPETKISEISNSEEIIKYRESHPNLTTDEYLRNVHHTLSKKFIMDEWELLRIPSPKYAKAIGLVSEGHRKVDIGNFDLYDPHFFAKDGKQYSCLPYLACILRIADELDVTNSRTPKLLTKYYMPHNELSIIEWSKHMNTSQRNYFQSKVIFEVDCTDQSIYAALQDQFEKIQNVINYCQKIVRSIPHIDEPPKSLNLSLVEVKYNFINFDPKGIKFSLNVQNVVTAFIGEDLYKDRLTSLREAVQNSIDSCRYKAMFTKQGYSPSINIHVCDQYIRIEDNGMGMDEFIIENYFGRLASSFYEQDKIKSQFEAIGQFGVGVFSYFLLSEYIDIETKTSSSPALKFRFDKDPKSYFHFYDKTERLTPGTTITMYLKKELVESLKFSRIESYLRKTFTHVDIPINLLGPDYESSIEFLPFDISQDVELKTRLKLQERKLHDKLCIVTETITDEDVEGTCGIIVGKNHLETFKFSTAIFDYDSFVSIGNRRSFSQISISQKGIFVNKYASQFVDLLIGDINLLKKIKINIDRNEFSESDDINSVLNKFEIKILSNIFSNLDQKYVSDADKLVVTNLFLHNYLNLSGHPLSADFKNLLSEHLYIEAIYPEKKVFSLYELADKFDNILLVNDIEEKPQYRSGAIIVANESKYFGAYYSTASILSHVLGLKEQAVKIDEKFYQVYSKDYLSIKIVKTKNALKGLISREYIPLADVQSKCLLFSIWTDREQNDKDAYYYDEDLYFNLNHHFLRFIVNNEAKIQESADFKKIVSSVFTYLIELSHQNITDNQISKLNDMLLPLNVIQRLKKLTTSEFNTVYMDYST